MSLYKIAATRFDKVIKELASKGEYDKVIDIFRRTTGHSVPYKDKGHLLFNNLLSGADTLTPQQKSKLVNEHLLAIYKRPMNIASKISDHSKFRTTGELKIHPNEDELSNYNFYHNKMKPKKGKTVKTYAEAHNIDPEEYIPVIHGGGKSHINNFLKGNSKGYKLEDGVETGIQVHPIVKGNKVSRDIHERTKFYSARAYNYGDSPAQLTGRIKAKYLNAAPNGYEAGIPAKHVDKIEKTHVKQLPFETGYMSIHTADNVESRYRDIIGKQ